MERPFDASIAKISSLNLHLPQLTPMLRISVNECEGNIVTLRLEGQITGAWISELKEACERMLTAGYKVTLALSDVSLIDRPALTPLASLRSAQ
jgi:hypothetical protein